MNITRTPRPGFTLIEVMISVLILALGLLGLGAVIPVIVAQQRKAADATLAVSSLNAGFAQLDGRGSDTGATLWKQYLLNCRWSPNGEWEVGERRQCTNSAVPWTGPDPATYEYRAIIDQEHEVLDAAQSGRASGDALWNLDIQVERRTRGVTPGPWQAFGTAQSEYELVRSVDRLFPSKDAAAGPRPGLVWDVAARRVGSREVLVALFARRVDPGIRLPRGDTVYNLIEQGNAAAVAVNSGTGLPTLNGIGLYSRPITLEARVPSGSYAQTRIILNTGTANERQLAARPGQQLVDEFGAVHTVNSFDSQANELVLNRPANWTPGQDIRIVFAPEIPVHTTVHRISVPY